MIADWLRVHRRALAAFAVLLAAAFMFRGVLSMLIALCLGGAALAFVMLPLVKFLSRRMKRTAAILTAFGCVALLIIGAVFMIVPTIIDQARILIESLPDMYAGLTEFTEQISAHVEGFLGEDVLTDGLSQLPGQVSGMISTLLSGAGGMAGGIADGVGRLSLIVILAYYFLKDRERMLMQLELLLPSSIRARVIEAGGAIQRELSGYVRGQLLISLIVGAITAAGLAILRIPAFLVLGLIMAVFNLIPYFGALLGAIPTVLLTLNMGWAKLLEVTIMLFLTQQAENMLIAPRLTGRTTGLHPVAVILALTAGGYLGGMVGMAFAIPGAIVIRGVFREAGRVREMKNEN